MINLWSNIIHTNKELNDHILRYDEMKQKETKEFLEWKTQKINQ